MIKKLYYSQIFQYNKELKSEKAGYPTKYIKSDLSTLEKGLNPLLFYDIFIFIL